MQFLIRLLKKKKHKTKTNYFLYRVTKICIEKKTTYLMERGIKNFNKSCDCSFGGVKSLWHSRYYAHFWIISLGKGMKSPFPPSDILCTATTIFLQE